MAKIQNLSVETLKIADEAITIFDSPSTSTTLAVSNRNHGAGQMDRLNFRVGNVDNACSSYAENTAGIRSEDNGRCGTFGKMDRIYL